MKKLLLSLLFTGGFAASGFGQIFSQNFSGTSVVADYVNSAGESNKFTAISGGANNTATIVNGSLRFTKTGNNSAYFNRGATTNANFIGPPTLLKISFSFQALSSSIGGTTQAQLYIGSNFSNSATVPTGANTHSRLVFNFGTNNDFSMNSSTAPTTTTALYSAKQSITWIINNTGSSVTYTTPDGVTTKMLANDKWDLYVGATASPVLADRDGLSNSTSGEGKDNALQNIYFGYPSGSNSNATIEIDDIIINDQTTVLPVSLTSFSAKAKLQNIDLAWTTSSEKDNSHFEILRSGDGKTFSKIGETKGAGTTDLVKNYTFTDKDALPSISYYQLKQIDFNGNSVLSEVQAVKSNVAASNFKIATNKQDGSVKLTVFAAREGKATFKIYDVNGHKITEAKLSLSKGYSNISVPFNSSKGLHIASLTTTNETLTQKFIQ